MDRLAVGRALAVAVLLADAATPTALGAVGVGVRTTPLTIGAAVLPGHTYRLRPDFYVANTGDRTTTYAFRIERLSQEAGSTPPPAWISFGRAGVRLRPGRHIRIAVVLRLPRNARSGTYVSDAVATGSQATGRAARVLVGAAAATPIRFTVDGRRGGLAAALGWPWSTGDDALAAGLVAALLGVAAWRGLGLRLVVERASR